MAGIRTELDMELLKNFHVNIMANIFSAMEVNSEDGFSLLTGYGIGVGYMSIIGPLRIGLMYGSSNHEQYFNKIKGYVSFGYSF